MSEPHQDHPEIAPITGPITADYAWALMLNGLVLMASTIALGAWVAFGLIRKFLEVDGTTFVKETFELSGLAGGFILVTAGVAFFRVGWKLFNQGRTAPRA